MMSESVAGIVRIGDWELLWGGFFVINIGVYKEVGDAVLDFPLALRRIYKYIRDIEEQRHILFLQLSSVLQTYTFNA